MKITDFGYNGEGVGKIEGKPCFVPCAIVGEEVEVNVRRETSRFAKARLKKVVKPSPKRIKPPCPYYDRCGGCDFQHINYEDEKDLKIAIFKRQLSKVCDCEVDFVGSKEFYGYRNKLRLSYKQGALGQFERLSHNLVPLDKCLLASERINQVLAQIQDLLKRNKSKTLDSITFREENGVVLVVFSFNGENDLPLEWLDFAIGGWVGIFVKQRGGQLRHVCGEREFIKDEGGLKCRFSPDAFHQVNPYIYPSLYEKVVAEAEGKVLNAYSGGGVLSGILAKAGKTVVGVEIGQAEHAMAEQLKLNNNLSIVNIQGDCGEVLTTLREDFDTIILDPPRIGCDKKVIYAVNNLNAKKIIYISCEPSTLVRDAMGLDKYQITNSTIFDMFPRTANIESVTIFKRKQ